MEALIYTLAMAAGVAAAFAVVWAIGPKAETSEAEQADRAW